MLSNTIALIAVAAMFGIEAYKAPDRLVRIVLAALAVVFAISGLFLQQISTHWPQMGAFTASIFATPSSWFVLLMGLFFVIRPYLTNQPSQKNSGPPSSHSTSADVISLGARVTSAQNHLAKIEVKLDAIEDRISGITDMLETKIQNSDRLIADLRIYFEDRLSDLARIYEIQNIEATARDLLYQNSITLIDDTSWVRLKNEMHEFDETIQLLEHKGLLDGQAIHQERDMAATALGLSVEQIDSMPSAEIHKYCERQGRRAFYSTVLSQLERLRKSLKDQIDERAKQ